MYFHISAKPKRIRYVPDPEVGYEKEIPVITTEINIVLTEADEMKSLEKRFYTEMIIERYIAEKIKPNEPLMKYYVRCSYYTKTSNKPVGFKGFVSREYIAALVADCICENRQKDSVIHLTLSKGILDPFTEDILKKKTQYEAIFPHIKHHREFSHKKAVYLMYLNTYKLWNFEEYV